MNTQTGSTIAVPLRVVAILGTALVGVPLAAPLVLALAFLAFGDGLHLDYLMPGELVIVVAAGGVLLLLAALVSRRHRLLIGSLLAALGVLFGATTIAATATGLASGSTAAEGWPLALVAGLYALYVGTVIALFVAGVVMCRAAFARHTQ